jgi:hypothetical protein
MLSAMGDRRRPRCRVGPKETAAAVAVVAVAAAVASAAFGLRPSF